MKSLFGNVVNNPVHESNRIMMRFAVDNIVGYYDSEKKAWDKKSRYFLLKMFSSLFEQVKLDEIAKGNRLEILEYEFVFEMRKNKEGNLEEVVDIIVYKYKLHSKPIKAESLVDEPKSKIVTNKLIAQYKNDDDVESEGNPDWMNE